MNNETAGRLEVWLTAKELSRTELAALLGVSVPLVSLVLAGKRPASAGFKARFTRAFGWEAARVVFDDQ